MAKIRRVFCSPRRVTLSPQEMESNSKVALSPSVFLASCVGPQLRLARCPSAPARPRDTDKCALLRIRLAGVDARFENDSLTPPPASAPKEAVQGSWTGDAFPFHHEASTRLLLHPLKVRDEIMTHALPLAVGRPVCMRKYDNPIFLDVCICRTVVF